MSHAKCLNQVASRCKTHRPKQPSMDCPSVLSVEQCTANSSDNCCWSREDEADVCVFCNPSYESANWWLIWAAIGIIVFLIVLMACKEVRLGRRRTEPQAVMLVVVTERFPSLVEVCSVLPPTPSSSCYSNLPEAIEVKTVC